MSYVLATALVLLPAQDNCRLSTSFHVWIVGNYANWVGMATDGCCGDGQGPDLLADLEPGTYRVRQLCDGYHEWIETDRFTVGDEGMGIMPTRQNLFATCGVGCFFSIDRQSGGNWYPQILTDRIECRDEACVQPAMGQGPVISRGPVPDEVYDLQLIPVLTIEEQAARWRKHALGMEFDDLWGDG